MNGRITINQLSEILNKAGYKIPSHLLEETDEKKYQTIRDQVLAHYAPDLGKIDEQKKAAIAQLARVDSEMNRLYGKGGKYELKNPYLKEQLTSGRHDFAVRGARGVLEKQTDLEAEIENTFAEAKALYDELQKLLKKKGKDEDQPSVRIIKDEDRKTGEKIKAEDYGFESFTGNPEDLIFEDEDKKKTNQESAEAKYGGTF